jgi:hypothetical protein
MALTKLQLLKKIENSRHKLINPIKKINLLNFINIHKKFFIQISNLESLIHRALSFTARSKTSFHYQLLMLITLCNTICRFTILQTVGLLIRKLCIQLHQFIAFKRTRHVIWNWSRCILYKSIWSIVIRYEVPLFNKWYVKIELLRWLSVPL